MIVGGRSPVRVAVIISLLFLIQQLKKRCAHGGSSSLVLETCRDLGFFGKRGEREIERGRLPATVVLIQRLLAGRPVPPSHPFSCSLFFFLLSYSQQQ